MKEGEEGKWKWAFVVTQLDMVHPVLERRLACLSDERLGWATGAVMTGRGGRRRCLEMRLGVSNSCGWIFAGFPLLQCCRYRLFHSFNLPSLQSCWVLIFKTHCLIWVPSTDRVCLSCIGLDSCSFITTAIIAILPSPTHACFQGRRIRCVSDYICRYGTKRAQTGHGSPSQDGIVLYLLSHQPPY